MAAWTQFVSTYWHLYTPQNNHVRQRAQYEIQSFSLKKCIECLKEFEGLFVNKSLNFLKKRMLICRNSISFVCNSLNFTMNSMLFFRNPLHAERSSVIFFGMSSSVLQKTMNLFRMSMNELHENTHTNLWGV